MVHRIFFSYPLVSTGEKMSKSTVANDESCPKLTVVFNGTGNYVQKITKSSPIGRLNCGFGNPDQQMESFSDVVFLKQYLNNNLGQN